jgi:ParB-like chromosome segregation protein Spo0J
MTDISRRFERVQIDLVHPGAFEDAERDKVEDLNFAWKEGSIQIHPVLVRPKDGGFEVIAGHRRLRAAKEAGSATIDVQIIENADEAFCKRLSIEENLLRKPPAHRDFDWADYLQICEKQESGELIAPQDSDELFAPQESDEAVAPRRPPLAGRVAKCLGISPRTLGRAVKLANGASPEVRNALNAGKITKLEAERLASCDQAQQALELSALLERKAQDRDRASTPAVRAERVRSQFRRAHSVLSMLKGKDIDPGVREGMLQDLAQLRDAIDALDQHAADERLTTT